MATVPVTLDAVPVVFWFSVGTSAATNARNVGVPEPDVGPAKTLFCAWLASVPVRVPLVVTGLPLTLKMDGSAKPTEVTEPLPVPTATPLMNKAAAFRLPEPLFPPVAPVKAMLSPVMAFTVIDGVPVNPAAVVALEAVVALVAVAALPLILIPHVPDAPEPVVEGAPTVL